MKSTDFRRTDKISANLDALQLAKTVLRAWPSKRYFQVRSNLIFEDWSDYERASFEDYYCIKPDSAQTRWKIVLCFGSLYRGDHFDYLKTVRSDNSTAYKSRPSGPPVETKFALEYCSIFAENESLEWVVPFHHDLADGCDYSEALQKDLGLWAQSGLDMGVICSKPYCWAKSTVTNQRLCEIVADGVSRAALGQRMICRKCGTREPRLNPIWR